MTPNQYFQKIQEVCKNAVNTDGTLKDHFTVKTALQEIFTLANEAQA